MLRTLIVFAVASFSSTAFAQSSLGITGAEFTFGQVQDESGTAQTSVAATVDVAVTDYHGFQGDLRFSDTNFGALGSLGAHIYLAPRPDQKYGLFATISDVDGRAATWGAIGAEGQFSWDEDWVVGARAGLGAGDAAGLDFIFGGVSIAHSLSPNLEIEASFDLAEFDEVSLRAISYDAGLTMRYNFDRSPVGIYASVNHTGLKGRDGTGGNTRIGFGLQISLGTAGGTDARNRHFRNHDTVAPLLRRGLY